MCVCVCVGLCGIAVRVGLVPVHGEHCSGLPLPGFLFPLPTRQPRPLAPAHNHHGDRMPTVLVLVALVRWLLLQVWLLVLRVRCVRVCLRHSLVRPCDVSDVVEEPLCGNGSGVGAACEALGRVAC